MSCILHLQNNQTLSNIIKLPFWMVYHLNITGSIRREWLLGASSALLVTKYSSMQRPAACLKVLSSWKQRQQKEQNHPVRLEDIWGLRVDPKWVISKYKLLLIEYTPFSMINHLCWDKLRQFHSCRTFAISISMLSRIISCASCRLTFADSLGSKNTFTIAEKEFSRELVGSMLVSYSCHIIS